MRLFALVAMAKYFTLCASSVSTVIKHTTVDTTTINSTVYSSSDLYKGFVKEETE
jgi:hypothetical protein